MNKIILMGRLTRDPELKAVGAGVEVANFTVAVDRRGAKEKTADFFEVSAWRQTAAFVQKYFHKGDGILIEGSMQSTKVDKDGRTVTYWTVSADRIEFPAGRKNADADMTRLASDETVPF